ncbi:hypothetical protein CAPI_04975 [Corynebacterium capitovis DSM 44611]|uniref:copper resistance CopC family protein n=1 Tax=Corynebacterium capitovis TaxID=131081 RepID=UPI00035C6DC8|nr:copper resistance CopC family protein [Corynebacterium capitovis]WKD57546.1 hypothetical protein CAPI_04975 [Corynebacterium capitovis DSM 44611]
MPLVARTAAAAAALAVAIAPVAQAHDAVVGGDPADGAVVSEFPHELTLEFSGLVQNGFNTFALSNAASGEVLYSGEPFVDGTKVTLDLPEELTVEPGEYRVGYQIVSSDGHSTKGSTTFSYEPSGSAAPAVPSAQNAPQQDQQAEGASDDGSTFPWLLAGGATLAAVALTAALAAMRRSKPVSDVSASEDTSSATDSK